jgi:hypothetical protein
MRASSRSFLAFFTILAGTALAGSIASVGCGGSVDEPPAQPDTAPVDTGITIIDSTADTGTTMMDAEKTYDVPGSLFDATIPDVAFEGGKTSGGCYACTLSKCKSEVEVCDKDPRCRGLFLCLVTECGGSTMDFGCAFGCGAKFDVSSLTDPVVGKAQAVGTCVQNKCADDCPAGAMMGDAGKTDAAKADAVTTDVASESGMAFMSSAGPAGGAKSYHMDPELGAALLEISRQMAGREDLVRAFSH